MRLNFLKDRHPKRFLKFSAVGAVNFLIDLSILNLLSFATGINRGIFAALFSAVSFLAANLNSYFWNKKWTFKENNSPRRSLSAEDCDEKARNLLQSPPVRQAGSAERLQRGEGENNKSSSYKTFLAISVLGVAVNIFIIYVSTTFISQPYFSDLVWLNVSKLVATSLVMFFNYFGYKKFVFKDHGRA